MKNYKQHYKKLRDSYINATKGQRRKVARDRMRYPGLQANILIAIVSAIEGFARAIVLKQQKVRGKSIKSTYRKIKNDGPTDLIERWIYPEINKKPEDVFSKECWQEFKWAVKYRNLLLHECTGLRQDYGRSLIKACRNIWKHLEVI